jgi:carbon monoxide dehydrogenase subunit G
MKGRLIALMAAAALALLGTPALAVDNNHTTLQGAEAIWYFDQGGVATSVLIRPVVERDQAPGSPKQRVVGVNVQVMQDWIDPVTGDEVSALWVSDPYYAPAAALTVDGLRGASVRADVTLVNADGSGAGGYTVNIAADWTPTGGKSTTVSDSWDTEFGMKLLQKSSSTSQPAIATGSMTGGLDFGSLGQTLGTLGTVSSFQMYQAPKSALTAMLDVASAESASNSHITGATAGWTVGDARGTNVLLSVQQNHNASGGALPATTWVEIYQDYCDTATNEEVSTDMTSEMTPATVGSVDPSMQQANVTATFTVSGYEVRTPDCSAPFGERTYTPIGPFTVTVTATWTGTGSLSHYRTLFVERTPDSSTRLRYDSRARQATAIGMVGGEVVTGPLTDVVNAFMYDEMRRSS